ncbi:MAG: ABC transporter ATP-binding protein [Gammaproteobacteria bacterium]
MLIDISGLKVSLGGIPVLHDVNLTLGKGQIYGLLGPNGAGKSTTIAAALGLLTPDSGNVLVLGKDPRTAAHESYARIGVLPEQNGFYEWMTAEHYMTYFAALHKRPLSTEGARDRLANVGLDPRPRQTIGTFSRGMRQRLGLARALIADPELLILDEPTNGLDPRGRRDIHDILLKLADRGVGILLCTHLLDDVDRLCGRVGIIVEGCTVAEGSIAELVHSEHQPARFRLRLAGDPPDGFASIKGKNRSISVVAHDGDWWVVALEPTVTPTEAWRELLFQGWPIAEIRSDGGGLEDLYLALTERRAA